MKKNNRVTAFKIGSQVQWIWMGRRVRGAVKKMYVKPVKRLQEGKLFIRNGSPEKPAYLVKTVAGAEVLKLHTELTLVEWGAGLVRKIKLD